jgi:hypothetical protein
MRDPNKKLNLSAPVTVKLEACVAECLTIMANHTKISGDEIVNTALRRFIVTHKDYFPGNVPNLDARLK